MPEILKMSSKTRDRFTDISDPKNNEERALTQAQGIGKSVRSLQSNFIVPTECLNGNVNETIRYYYSPIGQLSLSVFNLDSHTLHLKIVHQTPEIQACKVKIYSAPERGGFVKGPSHDLLSQACCTGVSTLTFSFLH